MLCFLFEAATQWREGGTATFSDHVDCIVMAATCFAFLLRFSSVVFTIASLLVQASTQSPIGGYRSCVFSRSLGGPVSLLISSLVIH